MIKFPVAPAALLYTGGILLGWGFAIPLPVLFGASGIVAAVAWGWARLRPWLLGALLVLAGWTNFCWRTAALSPFDLRQVAGHEPALVTVRGDLVETPSQRISERAGRENLRTLAFVEVHEIQIQNQWRRAEGRLVVSSPGALPPEYFGGQSVEISGVLQEPRGPAAEGLFDYRRYLYWLGIYHQLRVEGASDWRLTDTSQAHRPAPVSDRFFRWAQALLARGLPEEDEPLRLLWGMTLGWKTALTGEVSEPFMRTGTMHIFAISGLHIALIAALLVSVLRVARVSRGACGWVVIPLIWFYTGVTGWQPSAIRSTVMMTLVIGGWALRRPGNLLNSLAAAGLILLVWDSRQLFQASFQLSFFVVLSLALLGPAFSLAREQLHQIDPWQLPEMRPWWKRWLEPPARWLSASVATSAAAWLGSLPIIAWYFHLITPVSLLANIIIVPLSSFALASNLASLACGAWLPGAAELFNHSGWVFMKWMVDLSEWMARWPWGYFYVRAPGLGDFLAYYAVAFGLLMAWLWWPQKRKFLMAGAALIAVVWTAQALMRPEITQMTVLAVQDGSAIHFDAPGTTQDLLVDTGDADAADYLVKPFLRAQGLNRLPACILTHGDVKHVGGLQRLEEDFGGAALLISSQSFRSKIYKDQVAEWQERHGPAREINSGDRLGNWSVLHPQADDRFAIADDKALVLRGDIEGVRVLLMSDLGKLGQRALFERESDLRADIVIAGLPINAEPLNDTLLKTIQPSLIILTDSGARQSQATRQRLHARLRRLGANVLTTAEAGTITITFHQGHWRIRSSLPGSL